VTKDSKVISLRSFHKSLGLLSRFAFNYPWLVILFSLLSAGICLWITAERLTFHTSRSDLLPKNQEYIHLYEKYRAEFEDFDGMIVVVESNDPDRLKKFAATLAGKMENRPQQFLEIFYKIDVDQFKESALLYLDPEELHDLGGKIVAHQSFLESVNSRPGLNQLLTSVNAKISSGMVDNLVSGFLGEQEETAGGDVEDLSLLIEIEKQMVEHLQENPVPYKSPWKSFLAGKERGLQDEGYLVSEDETLLFLLIVPNEESSGFTGYKDSVELARTLIRETLSDYPGVTAGVTGEDVIASDEMVMTEIDVRGASFLALGGVALLYIIAYGGIVKPLLAVASLIVGVCWSLGWASLSVGHLNILSVVFTTILIGLGIDFGVHLLERYREERGAGKSAFDALENAMQGTGQSNVAGAIAIGIAFGGLTLTDFTGIAELGWIAGGGVILCMVSMLLLLPALIALEERWRQPHYEVSAVDQAKARYLKGFFESYGKIITGTLVFTAICVYSLQDVKFDYNLLNLQAKGTEAVNFELKILEKAKRSTWSAALIADSLESARALEEKIKQLPTVGRVESVVSALPTGQEDKILYVKTIAPLLEEMELAEKDDDFSLQRLIRVMKKISFKLQDREGEEIGNESVKTAGIWAKRFLDTVQKGDQAIAEKKLSAYSGELMVDYRKQIGDLKQAAHPQTITVENLPSLLKKRFVSTNGHYLVSVFPKVNIWEREGMTQFLTELRQIDPEVTGNAVHMYTSSQKMRDGYVKGGIYALAGIVIYLFITFRKPGTVLLILLPVGFGAIWTAGIMPWLDVSFNLANLVILPLILGIGVVDGVHIVHRYREEGNVRGVVLAPSVANAVVLTSLTTMIGFGSLMTADHRGVYSLGLALLLGVGACLVASFTLLPALLKLCHTRGWKV
jgi:uncharacterized protein